MCIRSLPEHATTAHRRTTFSKCVCVCAHRCDDRVCTSSICRPARYRARAINKHRCGDGLAAPQTIYGRTSRFMCVLIGPLMRRAHTRARLDSAFVEECMRARTRARTWGSNRKYSHCGRVCNALITQLYIAARRRRSTGNWL